MNSYLSDGLDVRVVANRAAHVVAERLRLPIVGATQDAGTPTFDLATSERRLLVTALDYLPPADFRLAARRTVARSRVPTAVIAFHPPWDTPWRWESLAYVAWHQEGSVIAAEMIEARVGLSESSVDAAADGGSRWLRIEHGGWRSMAGAPDADGWRLAHIAATTSWQTAVATRPEAA